MKFDQRVIKILTNYANIHEDLYFSPGNVLSTTTPTRTVIARARIDETIPREFAVHNLPKLISILKMFKSPSIEIEREGEGEVLKIQEGERVAQFTLSPPELILKPPTNEPTFKKIVSFKIPSDIVQELKNATSVFGHGELVFRTEGGRIIVETTNVANPTDDKYMVVVGEHKDKFCVTVKMKNFELLQEDYEVAISYMNRNDKHVGIVYMNGPTIEYFLATEYKYTQLPRIAHAA